MWSVQSHVEITEQHGSCMAVVIGLVVGAASLDAKKLPSSDFLRANSIPLELSSLLCL